MISCDEVMAFPRLREKELVNKKMNSSKDQIVTFEMLFERNWVLDGYPLSNLKMNQHLCLWYLGTLFHLNNILEEKIYWEKSISICFIFSRYLIKFSPNPNNPSFVIPLHLKETF